MSPAQRFGWSAMTILSLLIAAYALFLVATGFEHVPAEVASNRFFSPLGLQIHIAAAGVALLVGPFQFLKGLRDRRRRLHRSMGKVYVAAVFIGGLAGGAIAMFSSAGPIAGAGFQALSIFWLAFTGLAFAAALRRDFRAHEAFMVRSFALTFAAVTLRLYIPIGVTLTKGDFTTAYVVIAWACWVPNLLLAELWLATQQRAAAN